MHFGAFYVGGVRQPSVESFSILTHVIPFSQGRPNRLWNLRTLCETCNQGRGNIASLARDGV